MLSMFLSKSSLNNVYGFRNGENNPFLELFLVFEVVFKCFIALRFSLIIIYMTKSKIYLTKCNIENILYNNRRQLQGSGRMELYLPDNIYQVSDDNKN